MIISLTQAIQNLRNSEVVALPTETVYGLAAPIFDLKCVQKIFQTKERPLFDPLIAHVNSWTMAEQLIQNPKAVEEFLVSQFWPGPLTLVFEKDRSVDDLITAGHSTIAVRCPDHPIFEEVISKLNSPLVAPSANKFGRTSPTTAQHVLDDYQNQLSVVDGGACQVGIESTIIRCLSDDHLVILRPGMITAKDLRSALKQFSSPSLPKSDLNKTYSIQIETLKPENTSDLTDHSPIAPGNLKDHYQPKHPLLVYQNQEQRDQLITTYQLKSPVELVFDVDPYLMARTLYAKIRELDQEADGILVNQSSLPSTGAWKSIFERIHKAAKNL